MDQATDLQQRDQSETLRLYLRILGDLGRLAGNSLDLQTFLDQAVAHVARATGIQHVKILRYRPEMDDLLVVAGIGWKPGVVGTATLSAGLRSAPGRAFQIGEPISIRNFDGQDEYEISTLLKEHGIVSLTNAPLLIGASAWGVVEIDSTSERDFGQDACDFLTAAGSLIGTCVRRHTAPSRADSLADAVLLAQQREILLQEMQHRMKNSFQLLLGAITLQKRKEPAAATALDQTAERIRAVALAHEQLAPRTGRADVNLADYLRALCASINRQLENIEIEFSADEVHMPIERAIAVGLILNEAVTNSVKHAFGEAGGAISVRLQSGIGIGEARLTIADNGSGLKAEVPGSGSKLLSALARQIAGTVERTSAMTGTVVVTQFPVIS